MVQSKGKILLIEDDLNLGFVIRDFLEMSHYHVIHKTDGMDGLTAFRKGSYDLILLDIMLPYLDGFSIAEEIRENNCEVPIIFITARSRKDDRIRGFRAGADDYITKPFSTEELKLRIQAILRRTKFQMPVEPGRKSYTIGSFTFDYQNHLLFSSTLQKRLTKREADVLNMLCLNKNKIMRRDLALKTIWGEDDYFMGRSMDVYITKLRKMLRDDPNIAIKNVHNTGFMLEVKD
jgi:DNA-binding response OmpR family regulator